MNYQYLQYEHRYHLIKELEQRKLQRKYSQENDMANEVIRDLEDELKSRGPILEEEAMEMVQWAAFEEEERQRKKKDDAYWEAKLNEVDPF